MHPTPPFELSSLPTRNHVTGSSKSSRRGKKQHVAALVVGKKAPAIETEAYEEEEVNALFSERIYVMSNTINSAEPRASTILAQSRCPGPYVRIYLQSICDDCESY